MDSRRSSPKYVSADHLPKRFLDAVKVANLVYGCSPYVTCNRLFKNRTGSSDARIYLQFRAINFITGASSLRVLRALLEDGVELYSVRDIHAKVVLIETGDATHFSVGSQNLTARGRRTNREASFVAGTDTPVETARRFFEESHTLEPVPRMATPW